MSGSGLKSEPPCPGHPITAVMTARSVLVLLADGCPMTRSTRGCSMVVNTGVSTEALTSPAACQSPTIASAKPSGART